MMDAYDKAVEVLTAHPEMIGACWNLPHLGGPGLLFGYLGKDREDGFGCLTQCKKALMNKYSAVARNAHYVDLGDEFLDELIADPLIPTSREEIAVEMLPAFRDKQRKADQLLGREPPVWEDVPLEKFHT